jgi:hypothetical protein
MNIKNFIKRIRHKITPNPELTDEVVEKFLKVLEQVRAEEMTCSDMYSRLDEFVENEVKEPETAEKITPLVREHLDMCPECCEEYEALLTVLENTNDE